MLAGTSSKPSDNLFRQERCRHPGGEVETTRRVLLVDDHNLFRQVLAVMLEEHTDLDASLQAGSLAEARQVLAEHNGSELTLAVVDLELLDEDGDELIGDLLLVGTPVLVLAARGDPGGDPERLGWESTAVEVLTTEASSVDILEAVRRLVDG